MICSDIQRQGRQWLFYWLPLAVAFSRITQTPSPMDEWKTHVSFYCRESTKHKLLNSSCPAQELMKYQLHGQNKWELKCLKGIISTLQELKTRGWGIFVATDSSALYDIIALSVPVSLIINKTESFQ